MQRRYKPRKKICPYCADKNKEIDYKDVATLKKFISERGKILPRRVTGACTKTSKRNYKSYKKSKTDCTFTI